MQAAAMLLFGHSVFKNKLEQYIEMYVREQTFIFSFLFLSWKTQGTVAPFLHGSAWLGQSGSCSLSSHSSYFLGSLWFLSFYPNAGALVFRTFWGIHYKNTGGLSFCLEVVKGAQTAMKLNKYSPWLERVSCRWVSSTLTASQGDCAQPGAPSERKLKQWPSVCEAAEVWLITGTVSDVLRRKAVVFCHVLNAELSGRNMPFYKYSFCDLLPCIILNSIRHFIMRR